jgi:hypothetical protein
LLALCVVAFALGAGVIAAVLLVAALGVLTVFLVDAHRRPASSTLARTTIRLLVACAGWWTFALRASRAWWHGGGERVGLRRELRWLRAERDRLQFALGAAAYREDESEVDFLRASIRALERDSEQCEGRLKALSDQIRRRIQAERLAAQGTKRLTVERGLRDVEVHTKPN